MTSSSLRLPGFLRAGCVTFLLMALLAACSGLSRKPEISLAGIELVGLGLVEQRFVLKLRIRNPNDIDLPVNALGFDVDVGGRHFAQGASDKPVVVPRQGDSILDVKVASSLGNVLKPLRDAQKAGKGGIDYRIYGRVELEGFGSLPFDRAAELPLSVLERLRKGSSSEDKPL